MLDYKDREDKERMTEGFKVLRSALAWFSSHEVEKKIEHLPQWVIDGRRITNND